MINRSLAGVRGFLVLFFSFNLGMADIIITEIADPNDNTGVRYIEIHNSGGSSVALTDYYIIRWTNTNSGATSNIDLSSYTLAAGGFLIFAVNSTTFNSTFGAGSATVVDAANGGPADSNGDDNHAIVTEASGQTFSHADANTYDIVDMFGVVGEDGTGKWHEFEDGRAERVSTATSASGTTANSSHWNCYSDSETWLAGVDQNAGNSLIATTTSFTDNGFDPGAWDGYRSVVISGNSGFRLMGSPVAGTVYDDILGDLWIQGMTNGDVTNGTANVWTFDVSGQSWSALSNLNTASQTAGEGFLVYVFADTDFDGDDDLPVTLSVSGTVNSGSATVPSSGSIADGEYALAGNPYAQTIDWDDVTKTNMSSTVYVYDDAKSGGAGWIDWNGSAGDLSNGLIAPYQGFIIKGSGGSGTITIETADQASSSGAFYKTAQTYSATFTVTSETSSQNFYFSFNQDGNVGMDSHDAHKLMPLDITPRLVGMTFADGNSLGTNNLPLNLTGSTEIDVDVMSLDVTDGVFETAGEDVTLSWDLSVAPAGLSFMLTNTQTQETADLSLTDAYTFTTQEKGSVVSDGSGVSSYPLVGTPLLKLTISALSQNVDENPMPSAFALHPAYPNPFNPSTTITFDVPDYIAQPTLLQIYDISGSLVQTLVNGVVDPGTHSVSWGPKNLSSGIYIVELRAGDNTFNHKISYVK